MVDKYRIYVYKAYVAKTQGVWPNLAEYYYAIGVLEGYAQACFDADIVTEEDYIMML